MSEETRENMWNAVNALKEAVERMASEGGKLTLDNEMQYVLAITTAQHIDTCTFLADGVACPFCRFYLAVARAGKALQDEMAEVKKILEEEDDE